MSPRPHRPFRRLALALSLAGGLTSGSSAKAVMTPPPAASPDVLAASPSAEVRLGDAPVRVAVPLPAEAEKRLAAMTQGGGHLRLAIEGLQLLHPGAVYEVYLNLPEGQRAVLDSFYRVGNLSLFTDPASPGEITRTFDITDKVKALRQRGEWTGKVELTFVREDLRGRRAGHRAEAGGGEPAAFLRFTKVSISEH